MAIGRGRLLYYPNLHKQIVHLVWRLHWWCIDKLGVFMQTKYLCVLIHIWIKGEVGAPWNRFKPSSNIFYWLFQGGISFVDLLCFCSVLCLLCLSARLFICALWSPAGKGLTSWLSFVMFSCEFVTFPLVSWVGCGTWLYRFLIFAPLLTFLTFAMHYLKKSNHHTDMKNKIKGHTINSLTIWDKENQ